jgi:hypothetical protein
MVRVAEAYRDVGKPDHARPLLERAVRDIGRYPGANHELRLRAMSILKEIIPHERIVLQ